MTIKYVTVAEMVEIEQAADTAGYSYSEMMQAAGKGLAEQIVELAGDAGRERIAALVGSGNNGGDALVALTFLLEQGWEGTALLLKPRDEDDPLLKEFQQAGGKTAAPSEDEEPGGLIAGVLSSCDLLVDGVLGTGIQLPVRGRLADLLGEVKSQLASRVQPPLVVAVDCPSGVDCDSGEVDESCIPADLTVTMAAVKQGLLKFPAFSLLGELVLVDIGLPPDLPALKKIAREVVTDHHAREVLPERPLDAHKGTFGTALILAGSANYPGAALLSAGGAYRIGVGLVTVGAPAVVQSSMAGQLPEATWLVLEDEDGWTASGNADQLGGALERSTAVLLGPGLGEEQVTREFVRQLFRFDLPPLVIDADGLRILTGMDGWQDLFRDPVVLTPHPGEMAVMTGWSVAEIQQDRVKAAEHFADQWGHIVVLKGAHTVIAAPGGATRIVPLAVPALATAGTGDVLAGMITGLIAQGAPAFDAAAVGAWIHAWAGAAAGERLGSSGRPVLAGDVLASVPEVLEAVGR